MVHRSVVAKARRLSLEIAAVFRAHGDAYRRTHRLTPEQHQAMRAIASCRTAIMGGHLDRCDRCGFEKPAYNSCRNRHCPKCQGLKQLRWIAARQRSILPVHYFHVVFTLPSELHALARRHPRQLFNLLFRAASSTLCTLGRDEKWLGATLGFTAVLHTWTRDMRFHPHLHCIVTGGGIAHDGSRWRPVKGGRILFPVKVISRLFRGRLMALIQTARQRGEICIPDAEFGPLRNRLFGKEWVVYAKRPFGGPEHVYRYLGLYTHRVAISNSRLRRIDDEEVEFVTRSGQSVCLPHAQFIGRFLAHTLPKGFVRIRHYGLLASSSKVRYEAARRLLKAESRLDRSPFELPAEPLPWHLLLWLLTGVDPLRCPRCREGTLVGHPLPIAGQEPSRSPPEAEVA